MHILRAVSIFGLGKVGYSLAACLGHAGNTVVGCDPLTDVVDAINARRHITSEPGTAERAAKLDKSQLRATTSVEDAVLHSDISIVIVPTPSNVLDGFSLRFVLRVCDEIGAALRRKREEHIVSIASTILPGASEFSVIPRLEAASGRRIGQGLGYCYNPAFIALGEVINGIETPDYALIGEADWKSGDRLEALHRSMIRNDAPVVRMKLIEAEISKIACNTHETMRVSFANMLFSLCAEVPGADVDKITRALSYRMGQRFFKGAVPYGGPCWPRDNRALAAFMGAIGIPSLMPRTIDLINAEHSRYLLRKVLSETHVGEAVGLLGLSYKPGTPVIERSFGVDLAGWLAAEGRRVIGWDPLAAGEVRKVLGSVIEYAPSAEQCLAQSSVAIVINPMKEFDAIDWSAAAKTRVLDPWRCLAPEAVKKTATYVALGQGDGRSVRDWLSGELSDHMRLLNA
jgi:UDPglucose 6-dehydrogenase